VTLGSSAAADGSRRRLWSYSGVLTRIVVGRARVVREVRAAAPLMADLRAPITARGPWLTAVLNQGAARRESGRPVHRAPLSTLCTGPNTSGRYSRIDARLAWMRSSTSASLEP
jgi:hypothetical protein